MMIIDIMAPIRNKAKDKVNDLFNRRAMEMAHKERAYPEKRALAESLLSGGAVSDELKAEADMNGITVEELAQSIISKPPVSSMTRELERQTLMKQIEDAAGPNDIAAIMGSIGVGGFGG